ncbi:hypothetical protein I352_00790 [Cryptococcus deuterogattii MMRL2647]|nr:hypothetical protein I352_00790 [Cryptococcus deuterogattii MMRL2647]
MELESFFTSAAGTPGGVLGTEIAWVRFSPQFTNDLLYVNLKILKHSVLALSTLAVELAVLDDDCDPHGLGTGISCSGNDRFPASTVFFFTGDNWSEGGRPERQEEVSFDALIAKAETYIEGPDETVVGHGYASGRLERLC